ncbi:MAG: hypothetical protein PHT30_05610 [Bacilli bacterium]|nr:hypothetical protein [Bacilli bacterium]
MKTTIMTPFQKREKNYQVIMALITNFKAYKENKHIIYDRNVEEWEYKLLNRVIAQSPLIDINELENLVAMFRCLKEDSLIKILADLVAIGVITIDTNKLPGDIEFVCHPRDFACMK